MGIVEVTAIVGLIAASGVVLPDMACAAQQHGVHALWLLWLLLLLPLAHVAADLGPVARRARPDPRPRTSRAPSRGAA